MALELGQLMMVVNVLLWCRLRLNRNLRALFPPVAILVISIFHSPARLGLMVRLTGMLVWLSSVLVMVTSMCVRIVLIVCLTSLIMGFASMLMYLTARAGW